MNPCETFDVPAVVTAHDIEHDARIDVEAIYCPAIPMTLHDPAEPAGYEICTAKLNVDENMRGLVTDGLIVRVPGGRPVEIEVDPEQFAKLDAIDLDDETLRDELSTYLISNA